MLHDFATADSILKQLLELPEPERAAFLDQACGGDGALRDLVERLLARAVADDARLTPGGGLELLGVETSDFAPRAAAALEPGDRVGAFRVERELGRGGMATVYLARRDDGQFEQQVALKVLHASDRTDKIADRFVQERQILASLNHPNIAHLVDGGLLPSGSPYVAMEYVVGEPIDAYADRRRLDLDSRLDLFRRLVDALAHAHRNLVIHRDIKPSNVLVTADGVPKLLDFGIAKLLDTSLPHAAPETRHSPHPMTPEYASPEQIRGEALGVASDVYQLGYLLYRLLAGLTPYPFDGRTYPAIFDAICNREAVAPSVALRRRAECDEASSEPDGRGADTIARSRAAAYPELRRALAGDLDAIVLKALRKEAHARYPSAESFADDIERYLSGLPVLARHGTQAYRLRKFVRRHRWGVAAAAVFLFVGASFSAFYTVQVTAERNRAQLEASRAEEVTAFLVDLVELSDPERAEGRRITVREVLDRASNRIDNELTSQRPLQATLYGVFGQMYRQLGEYELAEGYFDRSVALQTELTGAAHPEVAKLRVQRSLVYIDRGRFEDAIREADAALSALRQFRDDETVATADALTWRGVALRNIGDLETARQALGDALLVRRSVAAAGDPDLANTLVELGNVEYDASNFDEARRRYRQAIESLQTASSGDSMALAHAHLRLSFVAAELGDWDEAETQAQRSYDIVSGIHGSAHPALHNALTVLNAVQQERGDFEAAERSIRESLRILTDVLGAGHPEVGNVLSNLGTLRFGQERFEAAADFYGQAVELRQRALGPQHPITGMTLSFQAYALHMAGDPRAEGLYREALSILQAGYDDDHYYIANVNHDLGRLLVETGRFTEAEPMLRAGLATRLSVFGEDNRRTAQSRLYLAACLAGKGAPAEAKALLDGVRAWSVGAYGEDSLEVAHVDLWMADWLWRSGRPAAATTLLDETRSRILADKDEEHWLARTAGLIDSRMNEDLSANSP